MGKTGPDGMGGNARSVAHDEHAGEDACATGFDADGEDCVAGSLPQAGWHDRGYLPHLIAEDRTYFVTFRLADSLPWEILEGYRLEREEIVKRAKSQGRELSPEEERRIAELYSERVESYLDAGHGKCWLKEPAVARMVSGALQHFDGERYTLHAWVVMLNHVHVVLWPHEGHTLTKILQNWKSFTAHQVQKVARASRLQIPKGKPFWQRESYDHLVRDAADFSRVCAYTIRNPACARLCARPGDWPYLGGTQPVLTACCKVAQASPPALQKNAQPPSAK